MKRAARGAGPALHMGVECTPTELIGLVEMAESLGYSALWHGDARFFRDAYVALTLAATRTKSMMLGPGVSVAFSRHPVLIASAIATLDEVSGGRAQLGLGSGAAHATGSLSELYEAHRPVRALRESIELIRLVLSGQVVDYDGEMYPQHGGQLAFRDPHTYWQGAVAPTDRSIPIFVAAYGPQVLRLSGKLADGVLLAYQASPRAVEYSLDCIREGERKAGRPQGTVEVHLRLETMISDDDAHAVSVVARRIAGRFVHSWPKWEHLELLGIEPTEGLKQAAAAGDLIGVAQNLTPSDVRSTALVGSETQVIEQLQRVLTPEIATVSIRPMGQDLADKIRTVRRFAENVWPRVEGLVARVA